MAHLDRNNLISESQHGFMPGRSCSMNLIVFMDKVTELIDQGTPVDIFYLDFSKAFDTVPHEKLLKKMEAKGVGGCLLRWIRQWLSDRTQRVRVGGENSSESQVTSGVPQGSVLGPVLFAIFIDDLDECSADIDMMIKFADDTKGMQAIRSQADVDKLQAALDRLYDWSQKWGMSFNLPKCKIMHTGHNNPKNVYRMGGVVLQTVEEEKDIGVTVTRNLKPSKHCHKVAGMANSVLTQISKNFHYRDRHIFKQLYTQYVRPHLEFASPAWSPWLVADKETIEKVQIRAVNMVSGLKGTTYEEKCAELGIDTLQRRRDQADLTQAYKILNHKDKVRPELLFDKVQTRPGLVTRGRVDPDNVIVKRTRLEVRKHSYAIRVSEQWNGLTPVTKNAPTTKKFKTMVKKDILLN